MIMYSNTFKNLKVSKTHPIEDNYYCNEGILCVADGITRDPLTKKDFNTITTEEFLSKYPNPSGGEAASKEIVKTIEELQEKIKKEKISLKQSLKIANKRIKKINEINIRVCDYAINDFYGSVAAVCLIKENRLYYAVICDSGVTVFDKEGKLKFQTEITDASTLGAKIPEKLNWNKQDDRAIFRKKYRNNLSHLKSGKLCFGALTGEIEAIPFIKEGTIELSPGDMIICHTDGFIEYLEREDFIKQLKDFDKTNFEAYISNLEEEDNKYGSEKTLIYYKN